MAGIFICYRRDDSAGFAGRLDDALTQHFGQDLVFRDLDDIMPGDDFADAITHAVGSCAVLLVVIGPRWLNLKGADGHPRLEHPRDYVRLEISHALERDIRVIPVLVGGARMPGRDDLPPAISALARRQAQEITESRWDYDVGALVRFLSLVPGIRSEEPAPPADGEPAIAGASVDPTDAREDDSAGAGAARGSPRLVSTTTLTGSLVVLFAFVVILGIAFVRERLGASEQGEASVAAATEDGGSDNGGADAGSLHQPRAVRAPIEAFVHGLQERDVRAIVTAYPAMSADDQTAWRKLLGAPSISDVRASYTMPGPPDIRGDMAATSIVLAMGWRNRGTDHRCTIDYDVRLALRGSSWKITSMAERGRKDC